MRPPPEIRTIEGAALCDAGQRIKLCAFHGERASMSEHALIVVTPGACLDGPHTRTCRGFLWLEAGASRRPLMRLSQQMRSWPKEHPFPSLSRVQLSSLHSATNPVL